MEEKGKRKKEERKQMQTISFPLYVCASNEYTGIFP